MIDKAIRTAATVAALAILVGLTTPAASQAAAPVRNPTVGVEAEAAPAPAGLWQALADFWQGLMAAVFAGSEDEPGGGEGGGEDTTGCPPEGGENNDPTDDEGDSGPSSDPSG